MITPILRPAPPTHYKFNNPIVFYHENCQDGFMCAYLLHRSLFELINLTKGYTKPQFIPVNYTTPPDLRTYNGLVGSDIFIVDFSFPRDVLEDLAKVANLYVFDHHKTSEDILAGLPYAVHDNSKCGARLVANWISAFYKYQGIPWQFFEETNKWIDYIEDRDLWLWKQPHSKEFHAALSSYDMSFDVWSTLDIESLINEGAAILRQQERTVRRIVENHRMLGINGYAVPTVNSPILQSELGNYLCKDHPFAAIYHIDKDLGEVWSLRSDKNDLGAVDVSEIAKSFGGGGHKNAAGFYLRAGTGLITGSEYFRN